MISTVVLDRAVLKALAKLPQHVADKLLAWVAGVERYGLEHVRKSPATTMNRSRGNVPASDRCVCRVATGRSRSSSRARCGSSWSG